ncbi:hypothetical protein ACKFKF_13290 [Phormidesmis sp. 146-12]
MSNLLPETLLFKIHRSNGEVSSFTASGVPAVQNILEQIQRGKVFTQPSLVLADVSVLVVYPGAEIVRIDLQIDVDSETFKSTIRIRWHFGE